MVKIGLVQAPFWENFSENLRATAEWAKQAKTQGCTVVCFPEANLTGYSPKEAAQYARTKAELAPLSALAKELDLDILAGFMERDGSAYYLTHGLFRPDGSRFFYRKTHLGLREAEVFTPGNSLEIFPLTCGISIGFQPCVELHFPEITQALSRRGAQIIFSPHASPAAAGSREEMWIRLLPARSYDGRVYMACCNLWDGSRFGGGCMAADSRGETVAACFENAPALLTFNFDPALTDRLRGDPLRYFPGRSRPELY